VEKEKKKKKKKNINPINPYPFLKTQTFLSRKKERKTRTNQFTG
jgi:hypothetical protein